MVIFNSYVKLPEGKSHQPSLHAMSPSSCPCPMGKSHGKYPWPSPGSAKKISGSMLIIELYINLSHTHVYPLKSTHTYQYIVTSYGAVLKRWVPLNHPFYFRIFHQKNPAIAMVRCRARKSSISWRLLWFLRFSFLGSILDGNSCSAFQLDI